LGVVAAFALVTALTAHAGIDRSAQLKADPRSRTESLSKSPTRWDFLLPTLDGARFVRLAKLKDRVLVNFWGSDCPPCVAEMPLLEAFALTHPDWTVLLIATEEHRRAQTFLWAHNISLTSLRSGGNVSGLMRAAGNRVGALPFSVAAHASRICSRRLGQLTQSSLQTIELDCSEPYQ